MTPEDVTPVTRNDKYAELKLVVDLLMWAGSMYLLFHPDTFDRFSDAVQRRWKQMVHKVSIWAARQDIRSLPETEE